MKHTFKLTVLSAMLCTNAFADPVYLPPGSNLTYGSSSNNQSIMSSVANPAAAAAILSREDSQYRSSIISIGGGYEFGKIDDLYKTIDSTKSKLAAQTVDTATLTTTAAIANYLNTNLVTPVNTVMSALQQDGNASAYFAGHVPLTPFVVSKKGWGGSFVLDANVSAIANISFVADHVATINAGDAAVATALSTGTYTPAANDSTLLVKAAVVEEVGLGYSRPVLNRENGDLTAGVRVKYYQVKLASNAQRLINSSGSKNTFNASQTYTSNSGMGLDVGALWTNKRYRAGAWVANLNKPSFKYNANDLTGYTSAGVISQLNTAATYEMKPQLQLEGAAYSESQNWVVNGGLDANAVKDPVGRDFQWATLSAAYATNSWWIPGARIGYRSNRAGSKLSYLTGGLTLFKALSLDIAYGLDSVTVDGKSAPRSFMANLGVQMTF